jgi:hypothetical protein
MKPRWKIFLAENSSWGSLAAYQATYFLSILEACGRVSPRSGQQLSSSWTLSCSVCKWWHTVCLTRRAIIIWLDSAEILTSWILFLPSFLSLFYVAHAANSCTRIPHINETYCLTENWIWNSMQPVPQPVIEHDSEQSCLKISCRRFARLYGHFVRSWSIFNPYFLSYLLNILRNQLKDYREYAVSTF